MQQNVLRNSGVTNIYLVSTETNNIFKYPVKLRYMDDVSCYFAAKLPSNYSKPIDNTDVQIVVYTTDGLYKNSTVIKSSTASVQEVVFETGIPKVWEFEQMRKSSRFIVNFPIEIYFSDSSVLESQTYDISTGGVSLYLNNEILEQNKANKVNLVINIPSDVIMTTPNRKLNFEAEIIRETKEENKIFYVFKFININPENQLALKNILMHLKA